jgi:hypothetical protein
MKFLIISAAAAAALLAAMPAAQAQHQPTTENSSPPNSINTVPRTGIAPSGAESQAAASGTPAKVIGQGKYCVQSSPGSLQCDFASLQACEKTGNHGSIKCVVNPRTTTGQGQ